MKSYQIRRANLTDVGKIAVLANYVWLDTYVAGGISEDIAHYLIAYMQPENFLSKLQHPDYHGLVLLEDQALLGYALLKQNQSCPSEPKFTCELENLYIKSQFQGLGLGKRLLHHAVKNLGTAIWLTVNTKNTEASGFYQSQGFSPRALVYFELGQSLHENQVLVLENCEPLLTE